MTVSPEKGTARLCSGEGSADPRETHAHATRQGGHPVSTILFTLCFFYYWGFYFFFLFCFFLFFFFSLFFCGCFVLLL